MILVTGAPDPDCPQCKGIGVLGGCSTRGCGPNCHGIHTMRFCSCVNERQEECGLHHSDYEPEG